MRRRTGAEIADLACAAAGVGAVGPLAVALAGAWVERTAARHLHERIDSVPFRPVAIVPGARVHPDGTPLPILVDRLEAARQLLAADTVRRILVSGFRHPDGSHDEPEGMRRWLSAAGVPETLVDVDPEGDRTLSTMWGAAARGVRGAVICTQRFHLARSVFLARQAGIDAVGLVADRRVYRKRHKDAVREVLARYRAATDVLRRRAVPGRP